MTFKYFIKCINITEVRAKLKKYYDRYPNSKNHPELNAEYQFIINNKVLYPIDNYVGTYYTDEYGNQIFRINKRKYTKDTSVIPLPGIIDNMVRIANRKNWKPGKVYHNFIQYLKDSKREASLRDFEYLGDSLNYKITWAKIAYEEYFKTN